MPGPVILIAPNPRRLTVRSPPMSMVPAAAAGGCAFTRYLLLVVKATLSGCLRPPAAGGLRGHSSDRNRGLLRGLLPAVHAPAGHLHAVLVLAVRGCPHRGRPRAYGHAGVEVPRQRRCPRLLERG